MKLKSILFLFTILTLVSCENEEIYGSDENMEISNRNVSIEKISKPKCPPPVVTLSPCDQKFRFFINRGINGYPDYNTYQYVIRDANTNSIIDSGNNLTYGQYTNTVNSMQYCHEYIFEFNDWCWGWTQIYVMSDGCGNVWLC